ncbi:hypothetical protein HWI03_002725 [Salmonella enterica]|nr:hypothetical protein [Salmonella enterica]EFS9642104.1 hypothetical protein [Salmonella enterica]EIC4367720.1 hypothetical protein [Salmonella enterica]EKC5811950.1 hypothetical protein [Salmonella enterica]HCA5738338.1 hypothetical protein [Citrobacter freundii]
MTKHNVLSRHVLVIGVIAHDPDGTPLAFEILAENGKAESIETTKAALIATLKEEGFTDISPPYLRTASLEELAVMQEARGEECGLFPYH